MNYSDDNGKFWWQFFIKFLFCFLQESEKVATKISPLSKSPVNAELVPNANRSSFPKSPVFQREAKDQSDITGNNVKILKW